MPLPSPLHVRVCITLQKHFTAFSDGRDDYENRRERQRQGVVLAKSAGRYTGRKANMKVHEQVVALRTAGHSIPETARLASCSESQVKRVWALHKQADNCAGVGRS